MQAGLKHMIHKIAQGVMVFIGISKVGQKIAISVECLVFKKIEIIMMVTTACIYIYTCMHIYAYNCV